MPKHTPTSQPQISDDALTWGEEESSPVEAPSQNRTSKRKVIVRELVSWIRRHSIQYHQISDYFREARKILNMTPTRKPGRRLPKVIKDADIERIMQEAQKSLTPRDLLLLRLIFFCALRVDEACKITLSDIDYNNAEITIRQGKGNKDRVVPFPRHMISEIRTYVALLTERHPRTDYLFRSSQYDKPITRGRAWQIISELGDRAGVPKLHPHRFRHSMLTWLTRQGLSDERLMRISGHAKKETLRIYQEIQVSDIEEDYNAAVKSLKI